MIAGLGVDIIETGRLESAFERHGNRFGEKIFTESEIIYCERMKTAEGKAQCYAGRFAAKEAFLKAIGTGMRDGLQWVDIEISNDELGKPVLSLYNRAEEMCRLRSIEDCHLSLSHSNTAAMAVVILENHKAGIQ